MALRNSPSRHPGEPARGLPASGGRTRAGIQKCMYILDSGFRLNDRGAFDVCLTIAKRDNL
jgi:hypothetical protein